MKTLLAGKSPDHVAIHTRKFSFSEAKKDLQGFLDTLWAETDVRLDHFIKHQQFPKAKDDQVYSVTTPSSVTAVFRLWFGVTISFFLLPFVMLSFFRLYTLYCFVYSIYDRSTNFWWPYIFNLILERANKARDSLKKKIK